MELHAVILDLDGTLLDTMGDIHGALNRALANHGYPGVPRETCRSAVGWGVRELVRRVLFSGSPEVAREHSAGEVPAGGNDDAAETLVDAIAADVTREYHRVPVEHTVPFPGIPEMLAALPVPLAVLSNKPDSLVHPLVEQFFPGGTWAVVQGQRQDIPPKPHPEGARAILRHLGVAPERAALLGDSAVDMETARSAACLPVGAAWGYRGAAELHHAGAVHICYTPQEAGHLLRSLCASRRR